MPYNFEDITRALHRKQGKNIPKDQRELLEENDSWIPLLKNRPHGPVNVPNHVLQTVIEAYEANLGRANTTLATQPVRHAEPESESEAKETPQSPDTPASSAERFASQWSASPEHRRDQIPESWLIQETPHAQLAQQTCRERLPMSSLEEEEEDMEIQLPSGPEHEGNDEVPARRHDVLTQRSLRLTQQTNIQVANTPPCAQPEYDIVPATVKVNQARNSAPPRKRMKPISFGDDSPICSKECISSGRMQSLKALKPADTQDTMISSSVVPATLIQTQTQTQNATATREAAYTDISAPCPPSIASSYSMDDGEAHNPQETSGPKLHMAIENDSKDIQDNASTPLEEFIAAYPDYIEAYDGTQLNFVKACLCLEYLRSERSLRDYLYDEFIRMFSCKYLDYVNNAGPNREPLSAIEWFNIQSGRPQYSRQIIGNQNLDQVLAFYNDDAASIRHMIMQHEEDDGTRMEDMPERPQQEPELEVEEEEEAEEEVMEVNIPQPYIANVVEASSALSQKLAKKLSAGTPLEQQRSTPTRVEDDSAPVSHVAASATAPVPAVAPSRQASSPELGRRRVFADVPPSSMGSNAPAATQYMRYLSARHSTSKEAAQLRRERMRAAMQRRVSNSARSVSSRSGSAV